MRKYPDYEVPDEVGIPAYHPRRRVLHIRPEVERWKSAVMRYAWKLLAEGKVRDMSEAMRLAHRRFPSPGRARRY